MNTLTVLAPGLLTTVQDLGREGFGAIGVSASGAADALALRVGNKLLGNPEGAAALEMTLLGGTFQFSGETWSAISGSDFGVTLDGQSLATHTVFKVQRSKSSRQPLYASAQRPRRFRRQSVAQRRCAPIGWSCEHDATAKNCGELANDFLSAKNNSRYGGPAMGLFF